jgi:hypothetical protein
LAPLAWREQHMLAEFSGAAEQRQFGATRLGIPVIIRFARGQGPPFLAQNPRVAWTGTARLSELREVQP